LAQVLDEISAKEALIKVGEGRRSSFLRIDWPQKRSTSDVLEWLEEREKTLSSL